MWHGNKEKERQESALHNEVDELGMMDERMLIFMRRLLHSINEPAQVFVQKCIKKHRSCAFEITPPNLQSISQLTKQISL